MCFLIANTGGIEVNFQSTSMTIAEDAPVTSFAIIISGGDPMMVLGSATTVFLTTVDGSASELYIIMEIATYKVAMHVYVTVIWKTDFMVTNTEIHLPVDESHTCALSRNTKHSSLDAFTGGFFPTL